MIWASFSYDMWEDAESEEEESIHKFLTCLIGSWLQRLCSSFPRTVVIVTKFKERTGSCYFDNASSCRGFCCCRPCGTSLCTKRILCVLHEAAQSTHKIASHTTNFYEKR